jgi:hypothetical protein
MSQKSPHRDRDRAAQQRRKQQQLAKKAKKARRLELRQKRDAQS